MRLSEYQARGRFLKTVPVNFVFYDWYGQLSVFTFHDMEILCSTIEKRRPSSFTQLNYPENFITSRRVYVRGPTGSSWWELAAAAAVFRKRKSEGLHYKFRVWISWMKWGGRIVRWQHSTESQLRSIGRAPAVAENKSKFPCEKLVLWSKILNKNGHIFVINQNRDT